MVIQFEPIGYMVAEGSFTMLRVVKIGAADVTVSVSLSTVAGSAGITRGKICVYTTVSMCRAIVLATHPKHI